MSLFSSIFFLYMTERGRRLSRYQYALTWSPRAANYPLHRCNGAVFRNIPRTCRINYSFLFPSSAFFEILENIVSRIFFQLISSWMQNATIWPSLPSVLTKVIDEIWAHGRIATTKEDGAKKHKQSDGEPTVPAKPTVRLHYVDQLVEVKQGEYFWDIIAPSFLQKHNMTCLQQQMDGTQLFFNLAWQAPTRICISVYRSVWNPCW